ncbi:hypothetical protein CPC08DRAFT_637390 [Agrocybe pediades]|nr:hypothetical protein CPC08DRAFT_637390 [Agrocybe pediades]
MSQPTKVKPYTYAEVVKTYEKPDVQQDLNDACSKLAHAMSAMMDKFDAITRQMHTIDMLRRGPPLKPKWDSLRQDFAEFLWQFRSNSGIISGRFKLFHSTVLPMCTQILKPARLANRPESMQVLHSFITVSGDHALFHAML